MDIFLGLYLIIGEIDEIRKKNWEKSRKLNLIDEKIMRMKLNKHFTENNNNNNNNFNYCYYCQFY